MKPTTLLLIDDHFFVRMGLAISLESEDDIEIVAQAEDLETALSLFRQHRPDVTVLDQQLVDCTGTEVMLAILAEFPDARILFLSVDQSEETVFIAIDAGAYGYLSKNTPREVLLRAIREISSGRRFLTDDLRQSLEERRQRPPLSPRELEVLRLIVRGDSNKMIAAALGITRETAKTHISHIFEKLGVQERTSAAILALQRGLVPPPGSPL